MRASSQPGPEAASIRGPSPPPWMLALALGACSTEPIEADGQLGRSIELATGDPSPLPRLAFIDEGCPGQAGGCEASGDRACSLLLIDSLAPLTALRDPDATGSRLVAEECIEVRPARGLAEPDLRPEDLDAAVARFRFRNLPVVRAPDQDGWSWTAGDQNVTIEPGGVLGGNLLRNFAVALRFPVPPPPGVMTEPEPPSVALYTEFPGSEDILADQGRAFLPLQFPGRLLGRELTDRCELDEGRCELDGFDVSTSAAEIPLAASRMVMDACLAIPPCSLRYVRSATDPYGDGRCALKEGPTSDLDCTPATDAEGGGFSASLVVATGVPGLVLFSDSARRMFGDLDAIEPCPEMISPTTEIDPTLRVCRIADDGVLHVAGWPSAGEDAPLTRLRVRSVALTPGAARSRAEGPCERAENRRQALFSQCDRYDRAARSSDGEVDIRNAAPPYSAQRDDQDQDRTDPAATSLAVLGEAALADDADGPRPSRWLPTIVLPVEHPLVLALRRDVAPDALEPDGLLGAAVLRGTETVLDYTDLNPALRVTCLEPHEGRCQVLPNCRDDRSEACCHGLPRTLLDEIIRTLDDDTCCGALSSADLDEMAQAGHCEDVSPP